MTTREGAARLARVVRDRMLELGMGGASDIYAAGGPAPTTTREILSGDPKGKDYWPATLRKLDQALRWQVGSSASVVAGGEPVTVDAPGRDLPPGVTIDLVIDPEVWDGMTPAQQQEARAAATVAILAKLRELGIQ